MRSLATLVALERPHPYDGSQLAPHFIRRAFGIPGDAAVAWRGPCRVEGARLVDLADREAGRFIAAREMLHLMVERFDPDLTVAILLQRLLAGLVAERVRGALDAAAAARVRRKGDDVFVGDGKLSVSIATVSPVSSLIHFGINVDAAGAPVATAALGALGIPVAPFAAGLLGDLAAEAEGVIEALGKVVPAHPPGEAW